jgi:hypothetical protein
MTDAESEDVSTMAVEASGSVVAAPTAGAADLAGLLLRMQRTAGNRATARYVAAHRGRVVARQEVGPKEYDVPLKVVSPKAIIIPPDQPCAPAGPMASLDDESLGDDLTPTSTADPGIVLASRMAKGARVLARQPKEPRPAPPAPVGSGSLDPCVLAPAQPGSISQFESEIRDGTRRVDGAVLDPDTDEIIGYYLNLGGQTWRVVDREGGAVGGGETPLDTPLLDPIDFIPTPGALAKGAVVVGKVGLKLLGKLAAKDASSGLMKVSAAMVLPRLRRTSIALFGRAARNAGKALPRIARELTEAEIDHSFDRHAAEWFGIAQRQLQRGLHFAPWRELLQQATARGRRFAWSLRGTDTIAHLWKTESGYICVQFSTEAGNELMSAFRPRGQQLKHMLELIRLAGG